AACSPEQAPAAGAQAERASKLVAGVGIRALDVGVLRPGSAAARVHVHRTRFGSRVVVLFAVDALRRTVFVRGAYSHRIAVAADRDANAEPVVVSRVRRLEERLLHPRRAVANEHIAASGGCVRLLVHNAAEWSDAPFQTVLLC